MLLAGAPGAALGEDRVDGHVQLESRLFVQEPLHPEQTDFPVAVAPALRPRIELPLGDELMFSLHPFARMDSMDPHRAHVDLRQAALRLQQVGWRLSLGFDTVLWGVTETQHLPQIVNQVDLIDQPDGKAWLGQPMIRVDTSKGPLSAQAMVMTGFRKMRFPSPQGRYRLGLPVSEDVYFTHDRTAASPDAAIRVTAEGGGATASISYFNGTDRRPRLDGEIIDGEVVLVPTYPWIHQSGLELQWLTGRVHLKGDGIAIWPKDLDEDPVLAASVGVEITLGVVMDTELAVLSEWMGDSRGTDSPNPYQNDGMAGLRLTGFGTAGGQLLAGAVLDLDHGGWLLQAEAGRRLYDRVRLDLVVRALVGTQDSDPHHELRQDDSITLTLGYAL